MAEDEDGTRPPKVVKFRPKGSPKEDPIVPTLKTKFETAADEWVARPRRGKGSITMTALAKKWGVHRVTLQTRKKKENWEKRKLEYERLLEEKRARLSTPPSTPPPPLQDATDPGQSKEVTETVRQARVDESSTDKKAQAEVVLHEINYAVIGALANAMEVQKVKLMIPPKTLSELIRSVKNAAEVSAMIIGKPEPPQKQLQVFEAVFQTRGGAINTIERLPNETLEDAMERLDNEHSEAKERLVSSFIKPAG